jgi:GNAT superfamily N-acetyltransferase
MTIEVRPIRAGELEQALPFFAGYQSFYGVERPDDDRNLAFFGQFLEPSQAGLVLGAWDDGTLVGFACLYWTFPSVSAADIALMNDLFVAAEARGKGVGRALIEAAVEAARDKGCHHLEWYTAPDNVTAQRLYDSTGATRSTWVAYEIPTQSD